MERETGFEPATSTLAMLGPYMLISNCQNAPFSYSQRLTAP